MSRHEEARDMNRNRQNMLEMVFRKFGTLDPNPNSPVSKRNKSSDLGDFGAKPQNLHTGSVFCAEED